MSSLLDRKVPAHRFGTEQTLGQFLRFLLTFDWGGLFFRGIINYTENLANQMVINTNPQEDPDPIEIFDRNCVLILDENKKHLDYLTVCFAQQNFKVLSHTYGKLGLRTAQKSLPDCIIINTEMLDMDGLTLCQSIVDDSNTCGIPVIMMGKVDDTSVIKNAKAAGCEYFVSKPVDPKAMIFLVNESIAEARSWICE